MSHGFPVAAYKLHDPLCIYEMPCKALQAMHRIGRVSKIQVDFPFCCRYQSGSLNEALRSTGRTLKYQNAVAIASDAAERQHGFAEQRMCMLPEEGHPTQIGQEAAVGACTASACALHANACHAVALQGRICDVEDSRHPLQAGIFICSRRAAPAAAMPCQPRCISQSMHTRNIVLTAAHAVLACMARLWSWGTATIHMGQFYGHKPNFASDV